MSLCRAIQFTINPMSASKPCTPKSTIVLAPDGLFINIEHVASPSPWVESLWNNSFIDALHTMYAAQGQPKAREQIERDFMNSEERAANIVALVEDQCNWLRQIGFEDVDCYFKIYELAVFGGRRLA